MSTYWPTDEKRIEVRILIPLPGDTEDPQAMAKEISDRVGEVAMSLTDLPFFYVAEVCEPDKGLFDPPEATPLRLVADEG